MWSGSCSLFPSPVGGLSCSEEVGTLNMEKKVESKFFKGWSLFWTDLILQELQVGENGENGETFRICMIRPPQQIPPRESARPQSDIGVSVAQQEVVTFTLKLFLTKLTWNSCAGSPGAGGLWAESHTWTGSYGLLVSDRRFWKSENLSSTWSL